MADMDCLFCKIINGAELAWPVWEGDKHLACLTPFPNTRGFTVVFTKEHLESYVFALTDHDYHDLLQAARTVALYLDKALKVKRTGLIIEGMAVNHAHVKLIPFHGIAESETWAPLLSDKKVFNETYQGFISSHDGPRMSDEELSLIADKIREVTLWGK